MRSSEVLGRLPGKSLGQRASDTALCTYLRASRHTMRARPPAMTEPGRLPHTGTTAPLNVTSQPVKRRRRCATAISPSSVTAMVVNGFMVILQEKGHDTKSDGRWGSGLAVEQSAAAAPVWTWHFIPYECAPARC